MDTLYAIKARAKFEKEILVPVLLELEDKAVLDSKVEAALLEAIRISKSPGKAGQIGLQMLGSVALAISAKNAMRGFTKGVEKATKPKATKSGKSG